MTQIFEHTFSTGHCIHYQRLPSGTCYHADTPEPVVELLEQLRHSRRKIRLYYGDPATGQSWLDEHDVIGWIGRSTGTIKVPLLVERATLVVRHYWITASFASIAHARCFTNTMNFGLAQWKR